MKLKKRLLLKQDTNLYFMTMVNGCLPTELITQYILFKQKKIQFHY